MDRLGRASISILRNRVFQFSHKGMGRSALYLLTLIPHREIWKLSDIAPFVVVGSLASSAARGSTGKPSIFYIIQR